VLPTLVKQLADIKAGGCDPIVKLGNLGSVRDLSDVRDVVRAYHLALQKGRSGEAYNVGSGREVSVRDLFELVCREAGIEVELAVEPSRARATDIPYLVADTDKTRRELGWEAKISLENTVRSMLEAAEY
jgi:GDP-4-dehydro-6-deoxy-D-mannose reductase